MRKKVIISLVLLLAFLQMQITNAQETIDPFKSFQENTHQVVLDEHSKIIPWTTPQERAYDTFLRNRWNFIKNYVPASPGPAPRSLYPMYYFYCAYRTKDGQLVPDTWMNDVGEKIPNWFESARLYYAYTGDTTVMGIVRRMADYVLTHGISPGTFAWPDFPHTTANAGDLEFTGFTSANRFALHEIQVDHAAEIGLTYYRLFLYTGDHKYKRAAEAIANTLAAKARPGTNTHSPWPYRVIMDSGKAPAEYGANWTGAYMLLHNLAEAGIGKVADYRKACGYVQTFLLKYPMETGYWTDGHSDTDVNDHTYKSNLSASNFSLMLFDYPEFDPKWKEHIPSLISWTEKWFVHRGAPGEPGEMWGANIVGEQDQFMHKMDYQTARYGATCARWYAVSGDASYKEKAYRALNWVTYCSDSVGKAFESPLSKDISNWWSDCYGEGPRMFYHAFAAIPEWAPPGEDHILYSEGILKEVRYSKGKTEYTATGGKGTEFIRLAYKPAGITLNKKALNRITSSESEGFILKELGKGDYSLQIVRKAGGRVVITEK